MEDFTLINKVITEVSLNKLSLKKSLKKYNDNLSREDFLLITKFSSLYFRNYYLIKHLANNFNFKDNTIEFIALGILLINNSFLEIKDKSIATTEFLTLIISLKYNLSKEDLNLLNEVSLKKRNFVFNDLKIGSVEYYSIRLNKPQWLIKLLMNQYNRKEGLNLLFELNKMPKQYVSVFIDVKFSPSELYEKINDDLYLYKNNKSIRQEDEYYRGDIYLIQKALSDLIDNYKDYKDSLISFIINDEGNGIFKFIKKYLNKNNKLEVYLLNKDKNKSDFIKLNGLKKYKDLILFYNEEENFNLIDIPYDNNLIVYTPLSSNLELFRKNPEYSIIFDSTKINSYISKINKELVILLNKLSENGELLFISPTLNLNETYYLIHKLIDKLDNKFIIKKEHLYVPQAIDNSILYYAIIRRNND